ncbi:MAG TPA: acyloxyacyl hydrolase [Thermodesulfobacteriota bacterium]|nr:acyloxyacyl hydrolase [Thermodesulfobacteriota bacterium]
MNKYIFILLVSVIFIYSPDPANSEDIEYRTVGLRLGTSNYNERDFRSLEIDTNIGLPLTYKIYSSPNLYIKPKLNFSAGGLKQKKDTGYFFTLSGGLALFAIDNKLVFDLAGGGALVTEDDIGEHNFGGPFQFAAHGGLAYKLTEKFLVGYRFYHLSDAGIFDGRGLNRHLLELAFYF